MIYERGIAMYVIVIINRKILIVRTKTCDNIEDVCKYFSEYMSLEHLQAPIKTILDENFADDIQLTSDLYVIKIIKTIQE